LRSFKKLPKVNNHPIGENSANLVTLAATFSKNFGASIAEFRVARWFIFKPKYHFG
jgi:hypothetical protein